MKKRVALFDMDGVILDSEPQYDRYWLEVGDKYGLESDFSRKIKGTTMASILENYFGEYSLEQQRAIEQECIDFESTMPLMAIEGTIEFMESLKAAGIEMGLVTSSGEDKVQRVLKELDLERFLSTIVTPVRITRGKPDPMCYELAAKDLGALPEDAIVFEDALTGVAAGRAAGMKVVALSTTFPKERLEGLADIVIPNLKGVTVGELFD